MKKHFSLILQCSFLFLFLGSTLQSIGQNNTRVRADGTLSYFEMQGAAPRSADIAKDLVDFLSLESGFDFLPYTTSDDQLGQQHIRFQQSYQGIPIRNRWYIAHLKDGQWLSANGHVVQEIPPAKNILLSKSQALDYALDHIAADQYEWNRGEFPKAELVWFVGEKNTLTLTWQLDIYAKTPLSRNWVFVDVASGAIVGKESRLHFGSEEVGSETMFSGERTVTLSSDGNNYSLDDCTRGMGIKTYDESISLATPYNTPISSWGDFVGTPQQANIDAHFGAINYYNYFLEKYQRNSIDDNGFALISHVNVDMGYNGLWDGEKMRYSMASSTLPAPVSPTVCSHEISHGLVEFTAGLSGGFEQLAINESIADLFAFFVDHYTYPGISVEDLYTVGEELIDGGFRNIYNPSALNTPSTFEGMFWNTSSPHGMGVVHSHAYFILAEGKTGINDNGDAYSVAGIGREKAEQILYRTLNNYLGASSGFQDAVTYSLQATADLYGECSNEYKQLENAWYAVGLGEESVCIVASAEEVTSSIQITTSPNPAQEYALVQWSEASSAPAELTIYNNSGDKVFSQEVNGQQFRLTNLSAWSAGVYYVSLQIGQKTSTTKLILLH